MVNKGGRTACLTVSVIRTVGIISTGALVTPDGTGRPENICKEAYNSQEPGAENGQEPMTEPISRRKTWL